VAVLTLALGIGANTAIFTMINTLLLKSLPVKDPQQLVLVKAQGFASLGYPLYERFRDGNQSFSGLFATTGISKRSMTVIGAGGAEAEPTWAQAVSGNFFSVLGVPAVAGRSLTVNDDRPGDAQAVAVVSHGFWQRRFGLDPEIIGKRIVLDDIPFTIVGVTPPGFFGFEVGRSPDLWWPIQMFPQVDARQEALADKGSWWLRVMGRLKAGASAERAGVEMNVMFNQFLSERADELGLSQTGRQKYLNRTIELEAAGTGYTRLRGQFQQPLFILMAIAGLVLLIACANLAGLLLARGAARQREFSMRAALGASRFALVRQLATESLLLAAAGGVLGLVLAQCGVPLLAHYIPGYGETVVLKLSPDLRILTFTLVVSASAGVLFGLIPAWRGTRLELATALKKQAGNIMGRGSGQFWNKTLVVLQVALSCCLLIGAGLFVRTVHKLKVLDVGFNRQNLMGFGLDPGKGYDDARRAALYQETLRRLRNSPAVRSASISSMQSLGGYEMGWGPGKVAAEGLGPDAEQSMKVRGTAVGLSYFETMGIPLLRGRDFGPQDEPAPGADPTNQATRPVIIDQTSARRLFADDNPVGKLLRPVGRPTWPSLEVIGVVGDVTHKKLRSGTRISIYGLETHGRGVLKHFYARTFGDPLAVAAQIRQIVRELDPKVEVQRLQTMNDLVNAQVLQERTISHLASFFSLSALVLACLGLYGILSYSVIRRTPEIGVRMALGAQARNVLLLVVRQGMTLTLVGCVLGVILALALTRVVSSLLYGVTATDPLTFAGAWLVLMIVALSACYIPALRAAKVDPMEALRYE